MKCPLCKYKPIYNKNGLLRSREGNVEFKEIYVYEDQGFVDISDERLIKKIRYECPKCGILFGKVEK